MKMFKEGVNVNMDIQMKPIGIIHSEFNDLQKMPIQPTGVNASKGYIEMDKELIEGLKDLEEFSHMIVIYYFHKTDQVKLTVKPFLDNKIHGVFSTRTPVRPNHIGLSIVEIDEIKENIVKVKNIDVLNGTPVLDIKPYVPDFDVPKSEVKIGWLSSNAQNAITKLSDDRFIER